MQPNITLNVTIATPEAAFALLSNLGIMSAGAPPPAPVMPQPAPAPMSITNQPPAVPPVVTTAAAPPPVQPSAPPPVQQVPTATPTFALPDLHKAASSLVDAGKREALVALLGGFGVQAVTRLPPAQYGAFATELRKMGAAI